MQQLYGFLITPLPHIYSNQRGNPCPWKLHELSLQYPAKIHRYKCVCFWLLQKSCSTLL